MGDIELLAEAADVVRVCGCVDCRDLDKLDGFGAFADEPAEELPDAVSSSPPNCAAAGVALVDLLRACADGCGGGCLAEAVVWPFNLFAGTDGRVNCD